MPSRTLQHNRRLMHTPQENNNNQHSRSCFYAPCSEGHALVSNFASQAVKYVPAYAVAQVPLRGNGSTLHTAK